jgi:hypothetical protein
MNLHELLKKAQWGKLEPQELAEVVRQISAGENDLYTLLHILGRAGSPKYRRLMEQYLHYEKDSQLSALVLNALCNWWGLIDEYRGELISFLRGAEWDADDYVKLQAISLAGEYLRNHRDRELLQIIYDIFADKDERPLLRSEAYCALCRSERLEWANIPPASKLVDFTTEVDSAVIERVQRKLHGSLN